MRKDLNFLDDKAFRMVVCNQLRTDILKRMERDKEFLKSCNLMDYSLLIVFFRKGGNRGQTSSLSFSRKVSVVVRQESEGKGKVLTFEEVEGVGSNKNLNIFGIAPAINSVPSEKDHPHDKSNSLHFGGIVDDRTPGGGQVNKPKTKDFI